MNDAERVSDGGSKGWTVALAGLGVNLALGVLYSWSVFAQALRVQGWTATQTQIPYMVACAVFAACMVPAGRLQDRYGPKPVLIAASVCTGAAFVLSGFLLTLPGLVVCFGVIFGAGMALGYTATTPAAIKWFHPGKRGLVSGIVVSGFGLAGIYVAPLTTFLLHSFSLRWTFVALGVVYCIVIYVLQSFIMNPPAGYIPPVPAETGKKKLAATRQEYGVRQMLGTYQAYVLWLMFFCGTFAGLKILGQLSGIGKEQAMLGTHEASFLVMVYALFNCAGRFSCGILSDKIGRRGMLFILFFMQAAAFLFFSRLDTLALLSLGTACVAFSFGGMLSVFPSITADYYGIQNLGLNYGVVFTAWGAGGVLGPLLGGAVRDSIGSLDLSYWISAAVCALGMALSITAVPPGEKIFQLSRIGRIVSKDDP